MTESNLFSAFSLNDKIFRNRIILSPMCQYKANNGFIDEWHLQHYSRFAFSGLGGAFIEATAVSPEGRIGYGCTGIWNDDHIEGLKKRFSYCSKVVPTDNPAVVTLYPEVLRLSWDVDLTDVNKVLSV